LNASSSGYEVTTVARPRPVGLHWLFLFCLVAGGYAVGYKLAQNWFSAEDQGASFFPPAGLTLGTLVLVGRRRWPVVLAAAGITELALDLDSGTRLLACLGLVAANVSEPLVGAALLTSIVAVVDLRRTRDLAAFLLCAVITAPVVGAAIAASTFVFLLDGSGWLRFAVEWWSGDGLGVLVVGSALIALRPLPRLGPARAIEATLLAGAAVTATAMAFHFGRFELVYVPIALLVVVAFRVGTAGVAVTAAAVAFIAAGSAAEAKGFWDVLDVTPANRALYLQLGLGLVIAAALALAAEISERERIAGELARSESEKQLALERAELYDAERTSRERAELLERHAAHVAAAQSVPEISQATMSDLEAAGIEIAVIGILDGESVQTVGASGIPREARERLARFPLESASVLTDTIRSGASVFVDAPDEYESRYPSFADVRRATGAAAVLGVPLRGSRGETLGAIAVSARSADWFDERRRQLVTAVAEQTALALERAASFERERDARRRAEVLERHAAQLAVASTLGDVGETTISNVEAIGASAAWVQLVSGTDLELLATQAVPDENIGLYSRYPLSATTPPAEAARSGRLVEVRTAAELDERYPQAAAGRARLRYESLVSAPLSSTDGRVIGVLSFTAVAADWLDPSRRQLVLGLAEQCGLALERALLQVAADRASADAELLALLGEVLERATGTHDRAQVLVDALAAELEGLAVVHTVAEDGSLVVDARATSPGEELRALADDELADAARAALAAVGPVLEEQGGRRTVSTTLRARGRALGVLTLTGANPRLTPVLAQRVGTRAALALDNALLYEQERSVSHSLQLSLLGGEPSRVAGAELATAYLPRTVGLEVGGDWYDVFELPDGRRGLVVGDVVGHGLEAAKAMGQLRGAVRALAPLGGPAKLLENLDAFVGSLPEAAMATIAYVELDPRTGQGCLAAAGHPPPLVVSRAGSRLLWEGRSAPLGSSLGNGRVQADVEIEPDETLLLYTDGLVERRRVGLDAMLERLVESAETFAGSSADELVAGLLDALGLEDSLDDVCLLALRRIAVDRFERVLPALRDEIPLLRHALDEWLEEHVVADAARRDLVLAVSEAAANAAEHAYAFDGEGRVAVEVWMDDGALLASVRDSGRWREPVTSSDRGRGRRIIEALMDEVSILSDERGTIVRMRRPKAAR
jgi:serine/threonine-protein kinase RsbW